MGSLHYMPESRYWMPVGFAISKAAVISRREYKITDLKATAVEKLLNHSEPALIAHMVNTDTHLLFCEASWERRGHEVAE